MVAVLELKAPVGFVNLKLPTMVCRNSVGANECIKRLFALSHAFGFDKAH